MYNDSVLNYLNTDPAYRELDYDPLTNTINLINNTLYDLFNNGHISLKMKNILFIKQFNTKLGSIRLMAKVHKKTFDWRAIMNCQKHPTGRIALFLDLLI